MTSPLAHLAEHTARQERKAQRERIATAALQGLIASGGRGFGIGSWSNESAARLAIEHADALIAALEGDHDS